MMAADDQARRDERPIDDLMEKAEAPQANPNTELKHLLLTVLSALPSDLLDRLLASRVCFLAGDDAARRSEPIRVEIGGRCFPPQRLPSGFVYLNSGQLLEKRSPEESLFLVARKVAEVLLWQEHKSAPVSHRELGQLAEGMAQTWGFEKPRAKLLARLRNAIGLCCVL